MPISIIMSGSICIKYTWNWALWKNERNLVLSDFIGIPGSISILQKAFRFGVGFGDLFYRDVPVDAVFCYASSIALSRIGLKVGAITCSNNDRQWRLEQIGEDPNRMLFQLQNPGHIEDCITFCVHLASSVDHYASFRFDRQLSRQFWTAAVIQQKTDFVFQVFASFFPIHKFILAARSPVFRAMFESDMIESRTGRVQIVDVEPEIFRQLLQFLYTGMLDKPVSKELGDAAEKYQVETLTSLCRTADTTELAIKKGLLNMASSDHMKVRYGKKIDTSRYTFGNICVCVFLCA